MELSWADIVRQYHHDDGRAWADIVDDDGASVASVHSNARSDDVETSADVVETWADVVGSTRSIIAAPFATGTKAEEGTRTLDDAEPVPGDPVGIRAVQSILMSATQMNLSHFHTAGMSALGLALPAPSAADAMNSVYNKYNTSMQFDCSSDVYSIRRFIVGARMSDFLLTVGSNLTGLPDRENVWYEVLGRPMYDGTLVRFYMDFNKLRDHGLTLGDVARESFGDDIVARVSPDFMGMIDIEVPDDYLSQWLCRTDHKVCGTFDIWSCDKINSVAAVTKGSNILAVSRVDGVNKKTITSNDVSEVEKHFGVEAAAEVLSEITGSRTVSDFMARTGRILSFTKNSKEVESKGLLTSMGFERPKDDVKKHIIRSTGAMSASQRGQQSSARARSHSCASSKNTRRGSVYESIITGVDPVGCFATMNL